MKNIIPDFLKGYREPDLQTNSPKVISAIIKVHTKCYKLIIKVPKIFQDTLLTMKLLPPETGLSILTTLCLLELPDLNQMHKHVNLIIFTFEKTKR